MYTVYATNHFGNVTFEHTYLEFALALQIFKIACKCDDCECASIIDATTGEVITEWNYYNK
jgi:hypothetical protein